MHHYNVYTSITILYVNVDRPGPSQMPGGIQCFVWASFVLDIWLGPESSSDWERCVIYFIVGKENIQFNSVQ